MTAPMTSRLAALPGTIAGRLRGWRRDDGVAAVEFALVLPMMVMLFFGVSELGLGWTLKTKQVRLTRALGDMVGRAPSVSSDDLKNFFDASQAIMRPYDVTGKETEMVLSSILVTAKNNTYTGAVDWSCGRNVPTGKAATADDLVVRTKGAAYPVPVEFQTSNTVSFVLVETQRLYVPVYATFIAPAGKRMGEELPWPARNNDKVVGPASCPT